MNILSYEQWKESEAKLLIGKMVLCPVCDGSKEYEEECDCCGAISEHNCDDCDDDGMVLFDELCEEDTRKLLNYPNYIKAVQDDLAKLISWLGDKGICIAIENGFRVFSNLKDKSIGVGEQ